MDKVNQGRRVIEPLAKIQEPFDYDQRKKEWNRLTGDSAEDFSKVLRQEESKLKEKE